MSERHGEWKLILKKVEGDDRGIRLKHDRAFWGH